MFYDDFELTLKLFMARSNLLFLVFTWITFKLLIHIQYQSFKAIGSLVLEINTLKVFTVYAHGGHIDYVT